MQKINRGQRIMAKLNDPTREDRSISYWLILYIIFKNRKITFDAIENEVKKLWGKRWEKEKNFYLDFGGYSDGYNYNPHRLSDALLKCEEDGYILEVEDDGIYYYHITDKGAHVILKSIISENKSVKNIILPLIFNKK